MLLHVLLCTLSPHFSTPPCPARHLTLTHSGLRVRGGPDWVKNTESAWLRQRGGELVEADCGDDLCGNCRCCDWLWRPFRYRQSSTAAHFFNGSSSPRAECNRKCDGSHAGKHIDEFVEAGCEPRVGQSYDEATAASRSRTCGRANATHSGEGRCDPFDQHNGDVCCNKFVQSEHGTKFGVRSPFAIAAGNGCRWHV